MKGTAFFMAGMILLGIACSESEPDTCLADEQSDFDQDFAKLEGLATADSAYFQFRKFALCNALRFDEIVDPNAYQIYQVQATASSNCDCLFVTPLTSPYCPFALEDEDDETFTPSNSVWFFGYMWDERGEYHPHCEYKDVPDDFKLTLDTLTQEFRDFSTNFILDGRTSLSGEGCWSAIFQLDEETKAVHYKGQGGCQVVPILPVDAFRTKVGSLFTATNGGSEPFSYSILNNKMTWTSPSEERGFVFYGKKRNQ